MSGTVLGPVDSITEREDVALLMWSFTRTLGRETILKETIQ